MNCSKIIAFASIVATIAFTSCERKEPVEIAGKGGKANIVAVPRHHGKFINECTMYIKYNTNDLPSPTFNPSLYDDSLRCTVADGKPSANFTGLKKGKYYIYGVGMDTALSIKVEAGKPVTITADQSYEIIIPVTEGD
jgi:hypothetical protein